MQLSYAPILGYSFDSTKVAKPIRQPILSLCRKGRRSMQLSYAPILGYSFDSTKVAKPIRQPIRPESWSNWNGWNGETDGRNADPPKKSGGSNKVRQGQRLRILA